MNTIKDLLKERILLLDGAMGTLIQNHNLTENDFRGNVFINSNHQQKGNNDILSIARPDIIKNIHLEYLKAGSDIIETNTFNSNAISQADYGLENYIYELNKSSAKLAKKAIEEYLIIKPQAIKFIAGSIGPTSKLASLSSDVADPSSRNITFDQLVKAYEEQIRGLVDGGVDLLLIETITDGLNARAAVIAAENVFNEKSIKLPIMISATITDKSGRILSGQTVEAFALSIKNENMISFGMNCGFGAKELVKYIKILSEICECNISIHPNAGFRNIMGIFDENAETTANYLSELVDGGFVNIIGGCCGTTPEHINEISKIVKGKKPRTIPKIEKKTVACGLEPLIIEKSNNFINIGERTNVAGSKKFAKLISEGKYEESLEVAREQVENGAQIIDINFDDAMLDAKSEMENFLRLIATEPHIAKVPIMIDSSKWEVIETALKSIQGKHIVNSISLKEGDDEFIKKAKFIKSFNSSVVVMAFDEKGQADSFERKIEVCKRAYDILIKTVNFPPEDIIFDVNILAIATGIEEHKNYAVDFIETVRWIKQNLPFAKTSGGVSNLSFAFRGNNSIREIMHSVFLYHAINAGLDMGIVNPSMIRIYEDIPKDILEIVEDVVLNRKIDAEERLLDAINFKNIQGKNNDIVEKEWRKSSIDERLAHSVVEGITEYILEDINEALKIYSSALNIIEKPLMNGMNKVGDLFSSGKMFLPQVIKSARVMKKAVDILNPYIDSENKNSNTNKTGKILLATVKGDVHDIGKNIVGVVLACNNFEIIDLGIMVSAEDIIAKAKEINPDIIGLSGLITPSLEEMANVAELMEKEGFKIPLFLGGATTSKLHTAVKIEQKYSGGVIRVKDASKSVEVAKKLLNFEQKNQFISNLKQEYEDIRKNYLGIKREFLTLEEACKNKVKLNFENSVIEPNFIGVKVFKNYSIAEVRKYINWTFFFTAFGMNKKYPQILNDEKYKVEANKAYKEANQLLDEIENNNYLKLNAVIGIFPANSEQEDILVYSCEERKEIITKFNFFRNQEKTANKNNECLADYVAPIGENIKDYIGAFVATAENSDEIAIQFQARGETYKAFLIKILADRLAEAFAERLHEITRKDLWGYSKSEKLDIEGLLKENYIGIRPAIGYPSMPDHSEKLKLDSLLNFTENTGIKLTENFMMTPVSSVSGLYFAHPQIKYFDVGKIKMDQINHYAKRKSLDCNKIIKFIANRVEES